MLEIVNRISDKRYQDLDGFFTFFGMYEDKRRTKVLKELIRRNAARVKGKVAVEAGAGLGDISSEILRLSPRKLYLVEENPLCAEHLKKRFLGDKRVVVARSRIEDFRPREKVDFLFHELYGALLLDESLIALEKLKFKPSSVVPNGGALLVERVKLPSFKDKLISPRTLELLKGALITDLFLKFRFRSPSRILEWRYGKRNSRVINCAPPGKGEVLVFGMEILHDGKRVCGTKDCENWPYIYTPVSGEKFRLVFGYDKCFSDIKFTWI